MTVYLCLLWLVCYHIIIINRVRTILVLGYCVLGNIHRYWIVLLLGDIFLLFWHPIQYQSNSSQHHPHASEQLFSSTCDLYSDSCNRLSGYHDDMLLFIKHNHCHHHRVLGFFVSLLCYTLVSVLALGIGIAIGQYYWVLDIGCLSWYRSNPKRKQTLFCSHSVMSDWWQCVVQCPCNSLELWQRHCNQFLSNNNNNTASYFRMLTVNLFWLDCYYMLGAAEYKQVSLADTRHGKLKIMWNILHRLAIAVHFIYSYQWIKAFTLFVKIHGFMLRIYCTVLK